MIRVAIITFFGLHAFALKDHSSIPLKEYGMIMAHDAASGYLSTARPIKGEVYDWTQTQTFPNTLASDLLSCGARSFDWRPAMVDSVLKAHHGDVTIDHAFSDSLDEILDWAAENVDELVLMHIWDCTSDGSADCGAAVLEELASKNVAVLDDCGKLTNATVGEVKALASASEAAGLVLALFPSTDSGQGCSEANYDESIACWGTKSFSADVRRADESTGEVMACIEGHGVDLEALYKTLPREDRDAVQDCVDKYDPSGSSVSPHDVSALFTYSCWDSSSSKSTPLDQMTTYMDMVSQKGPGQGDAPLYQMQALWEESTASVVIGELHLSSLVNDEVQSKLNALTAYYIASGRFSNINYVEVNNVCDGGQNLLAALNDFNDKHPLAVEI
mmetsp:Transcript_15453/g.30820  ORF Transcript_15453/g.30820 Transcript_15453/m.30820 type:complete len:389 (+) Transcript_15453:195-1361(+)